MSERETQKRLWRRDGSVDYFFIEVRPPRKRDKDDGRYQLSIEGCPNPVLGVCDALQALIKALLVDRVDAAKFFKELEAFAKKWQEK